MEMRSIKNCSIPDDDGIGVNKQTIQFIQNNDTWGDSDKYQLIHFETVPVDFSEKDNCDWFFRVTTGGKQDEDDIEKFWSVEGPEELVALFNDAARRTGMTCRWKCEKYYVEPPTDIVVEQLKTDQK